MLKTLSALATVLALAAGASAQDKPVVTTADFAGTWNIEVMSHQIALVIETQELPLLHEGTVGMPRRPPRTERVLQQEPHHVVLGEKLRDGGKR